MDLQEEFNNRLEQLPRLIAAVNRKPSDPMRHLNLGCFYAAEGDNARAASCFGLALHLGLGDMRLTRNLACLLFQLGRYVEAEKHFITLVNNEPDEPFNWAGLGECQAAQDKTDAALESFRRAPPSALDEVHYYSLSKLHHRKGDHATAGYYAGSFVASRRWKPIEPLQASIYRHRVKELEDLLGITLIDRPAPVPS